MATHNKYIKSSSTKPFKRNKAVKKSEKLYTHPCVEALTEQSRLIGVSDDQKSAFTLWVKTIYEELIRDPMAKAIMKIVSCSSKVTIFFMPEQELVCRKNRADGLTYGRVEQIFIAAKHYQDHRDQLKGLIIHEFCHFAAYETFCNDYKGFYVNDLECKNMWDEALNECKNNSSPEDLIKAVFTYPECSWLMELVVRFFQFHVKFCADPPKLESFKKKYPTFCELCESYVYEHFKEEYERINAIRKINQTVIGCENSLYQYEALQKSIVILNNSQIVTSNNTALISNYIYHTYKSLEHFEANFVFVNVKQLIDDYKIFEQFELAAQRTVKTTFVFDCESYLYLNKVNSDLDTLIKNMITQHIIILLSENEAFEYQHIDLKHDMRITSDQLTEAFIGKIKINFQSHDDIFMTDLLSAAEFQLLNVAVPSRCMHLTSISIGNQMKKIACKYYVPRTFYMNQEDEHAEFSNIEEIFEKNARILVADGPGTGKTIESIETYYRFTNYNFNLETKLWIVHVNLSDLFETLRKEKADLKNLFHSKAYGLSEIESKIFDFMIVKDRTILIYDNLDEISTIQIEKFKSHLDAIFSLNQSQKTLAFTRPHLVEHLKTIKNDFACFKMKELNECQRTALMIKYYECNYPEIELHERKKILQKVENFLQENNFFTPLLIIMILVVSRLRSFENNKITLYNIYERFFYEFRKVTDNKSQLVEDELSNLIDIHKYFQKHALENLITNRHIHKHNISLSEADFEKFKYLYLRTVIKPDDETLQRLGVIEIDDTSRYKFIHASFNDFFIAQFIKDKIEVIFLRNDIYILMELFSILLFEDRMKNVMEFLKCLTIDIVAEYLEDYDVLHRKLTQSNETSVNLVNIMPIINFLVETIANHCSIRKFCVKQNIFSSSIRFKDPLKTLKEIHAWKKNSWKSWEAWKIYVNENILMNKQNAKISSISFTFSRCPINIFDVFAICGKKCEGIGYYVTEDEYKKYFNALTFESFEQEHITFMLSPLKELEPVYERSFFSMARSPNKFVIKVFLDCFENHLLGINAFKNPLFSSFIAVLISNRFCDFESVIKILHRVASGKNVNVKELFDPSTSNMKHNWLIILAKGTFICQTDSMVIQLEFAIDFYIKIIDDKVIFFRLCLEKGRDDESFLFSLLRLNKFNEFEKVLPKILSYLDNTEMQQGILKQRNSSKLTLLQIMFCRVDMTESLSKICSFIIVVYQEIFCEEWNKLFKKNLSETHFIEELNLRIKSIGSYNIHKQSLSNVDFVISTIYEHMNGFDVQEKVFLVMTAQGDTISTAITSLQNETLLYNFLNLCSRSVTSNFLSVLGKRNNKSKSFLSGLTYRKDERKLKEFIIKSFEIQTDLNSDSLNGIYELFSNSVMPANQLFNLLKCIVATFTTKCFCLDKIFEYECPDDGSSVLIAAAKSKKKGRVEIFLNTFDSFSSSEPFKRCLLKTDNKKICALSYLLVNECQDNEFMMLFEKIETCYVDELDELRVNVLQLTLSSKLSENPNILYNIIEMNRKGLKCVLILKLLKYLKSDEKRKLILSDKIEESLTSTEKKTTSDAQFTLITKYLEISSKLPSYVIGSMMNVLFDSIKIHDFFHKKIEDFSLKANKQLVNLDEYEHGFQCFRINNHEDLISAVTEVINNVQIDHRVLICNSLLIAKFECYREAKVIDSIKVSMNSWIDQKNITGKLLFKNFRSFLITFMYLLGSKENWSMLRKHSKDNFLKMRSFKEIYSLMANILDKNEMASWLRHDTKVEEKFILNVLDLFSLETCSKTKNGFQEDFFDCLKEIHNNKNGPETESNNEIKEIKSVEFENTVFNLLAEKESVNFQLLSTLLKISMDKVNDTNIINSQFIFNLDKKKGETSLMKCIERSNIDECLRFFSTTLNSDNDMKLLIRVRDRANRNVLRRLIAKRNENFGHVLEIIKQYFNENERNDILNDTMVADRRGRNMLHDLSIESSESGPYIVQKLLEELENTDIMKTLLAAKDDEGKTPVFIASLKPSKLLIKNLELIEKFFSEDPELIKSFYSFSDKDGFSILSNSLMHGTSEVLDSVMKFYRKHLPRDKISTMIDDAVSKTDWYGNNLFHIVAARKDFHEAELCAVFEIIDENVESYLLSFIKNKFIQKNKEGDAPILQYAERHNAFDFLRFLENEYKFTRDSQFVKKLLLLKDKKGSSLLDVQPKEDVSAWYEFERKNFYLKYFPTSNDK